MRAVAANQSTSHPERPGSHDLVRAIGVTSVRGDRKVLHGIDVAIRAGEVFVILGPSGCGKTTLLRHLCGLSPPTSGSVFMDGHDLYGIGDLGLDAARREIGLSFQSGALLGSLTVLENVALPLRERTRLREDILIATARMKLEMVGLLAAADLLPADLSGGMRKRAAIARAIALDPRVVFLDEPSAGLDPVTAAEVDNVILKLNQVFKITMVVVTHDLASAYGIADRVMMLLDGRVVALGDKEPVWNESDPRIRAFLERRMRDERTGTADFLELVTL
jgi:phospholipid/cholesterol/gamma-HCH transport system ATP-binding protein